MSAPLPLRIYPCPAEPCPRYSTSITDASDHLRTAHPVFYAALERDFSQNGLNHFLAPADLLPTRIPSPSTVLLCLRCRTLHHTAADAEAHVTTDPGHAITVARDRARYSLAEARCHMPLMELCHPPEVAQVRPAVQYNYIYGENRGLQIANASPANSGSDDNDDDVNDDLVTLRALVGVTGAILLLPRNTRFASLAALLAAREPDVDWERLLEKGMDVQYASVKLNGGAAVMTVTDERGWRRVLGDAVQGARIQWAVEDQGRERRL